MRHLYTIQREDRRPAAFWLGALFFCLFLHACSPPPARQAVIRTAFGDIRIRLFNQTPEHRAYFSQMVLEGKLDSAVVGHIQRDLRIQADAWHSWGIPFIEPEIKFPAIRGAVAAPVVHKEGAIFSDPARFFIIQGKTQTVESLRAAAQKNVSEADQKQYLLRGGAPIFHHQCTVFGEVVSGMDVVDRIASQPRNETGGPLNPIPMRIELLTIQ